MNAKASPKLAADANLVSSFLIYVTSIFGWTLKIPKNGHPCEIARTFPLDKYILFFDSLQGV